MIKRGVYFYTKIILGSSTVMNVFRWEAGKLVKREVDVGNISKKFTDVSDYVCAIFFWICTFFTVVAVVVVSIYILLYVIHMISVCFV